MEKYIFTDAHFEQLKAAKLKSHRLTIGQFSKGIGRSPQTVSSAIKASRHLDAVHALFPMMKTKSIEARRREAEMQKVDARDVGALNVDTSLLHVRAATMDWRKAA